VIALLVNDVAEPRQLAARPCEASDQADPDRVGDAAEDDRNRRSCAFRPQTTG